MTASIGAWAGVNHACRVRTVYFDAPVIHVATAPHGPHAPGLCDFEDAGFDVVAVGVLPSEVEACPAAYGFSSCQHLLLRGSEALTRSTDTPLPASSKVGTMPDEADESDIDFQNAFDRLCERRDEIEEMANPDSRLADLSADILEIIDRHERD